MVATSEPLALGAVVPPRAVPGHLDECGEARLTGLVREHGDRVWRLLRRLGLGEADADDAFQEVILVVAFRLQTLAPTCERAFLVGTALRVARKLFSRRSRRGEVSDDAIELAASGEPDPLALTEQHRMRELLDRLLGELPYELRSVFVLYEIEEFTLKEIATMLELPAGTVATRLRRAREDFEAHVVRIEARQRPRGQP